MRRNGEIDILRFVFAIGIMGAHFNVLGNYLFPNAYIGVEFFLILIGYFMAQHFSGEIDCEKKMIPEKSIKYVISKMRGIYPYFLVAFCINIIVQNRINKWSILATISNIIRSIPDLTFTHLFLKTDDRLYLTGSWFLSAMFISLLIVCPLYLLLKDWSGKIVFPFFSIMIWGYITRQFNYELTEVWGGVSALWLFT